MELWTCLGCGTTLSKMQPLATIHVSQPPPGDPAQAQQERTVGE